MAHDDIGRRRTVLRQYYDIILCRSGVLFILLFTRLVVLYTI